MVEVVPLTLHIGAEIQGVDLKHSLNRRHRSNI